MPPYVGMARKQNGGYNASISVQTPIFHLVVNSTRLKTVRSARWCCPNSTMAPRLLENVVKVTNLEVVKIEFRHLPFFLSFFLLCAFEQCPGSIIASRIAEREPLQLSTNQFLLAIAYHTSPTLSCKEPLPEQQVDDPPCK